MKADDWILIDGIVAQVKLPGVIVERKSGKTRNLRPDEEYEVIEKMEAQGKWEPDEKAIEWAKDLIQRANHKAKWGVPDTGNHYLIDKENQVLWYIGGGDSRHHWHSDTIKTFAKIGYLVFDACHGNVIVLPFPPEPGSVPLGVEVVILPTLG